LVIRIAESKQNLYSLSYSQLSV